MNARLAGRLSGLFLLSLSIACRAAADDPVARRKSASPANFFILKVTVDVRIQAGSIYADVAFATREATHGLVQISSSRSNDVPDTSPAGQPPPPAFPAAAVTMSWNDDLGGKTTQHNFRLSGFGLAPDTLYYLVITAAGADGRTYRYRDSFSTAHPQPPPRVVPVDQPKDGSIPDALRPKRPARPEVPPITPAVLNQLADRGEALMANDPLAAELRDREPMGAPRRGFLIGMAATEGQTLPGPGKQRIRDALIPAEQSAFDTAVAFSLERNRNADLAARGAAIAKADPLVAKARTSDPAVLYWLGFDIATGLFGDPALGALGHTASGPGSQRICDGLSAAGQRGFKAGVAFHLARAYPKKP